MRLETCGLDGRCESFLGTVSLQAFSGGLHGKSLLTHKSRLGVLQSLLREREPHLEPD